MAFWSFKKLSISPSYYYYNNMQKPMHQFFRNNSILIESRLSTCSALIFRRRLTSTCSALTFRWKRTSWSRFCFNQEQFGFSDYRAITQKPPAVWLRNSVRIHKITCSYQRRRQFNKSIARLVEKLKKPKWLKFQINFENWTPPMFCHELHSKFYTTQNKLHCRE